MTIDDFKVATHCTYCGRHLIRVPPTRPYRYQGDGTPVHEPLVARCPKRLSRWCFGFHDCHVYWARETPSGWHWCEWLWDGYGGCWKDK